MKSESLSKEVWLEAAERIREASIPLGNMLMEMNYDGMGKQDRKEFLADMQLAHMAMQYVAEFATDKCRFVTVKNPNVKKMRKRNPLPML